MPLQTVTLTTPSLTAYSSFSEIKTPGAGGGRGNTQACGLFFTFTGNGGGAPVNSQAAILALTDGVKVYAFYDLAISASTLRGNVDGTSGEYLCTVVDNTTSLPIRAFDTLGADGEGMKWVIGLTGALPTNVSAVNVYCPPTQVI